MASEKTLFKGFYISCPSDLVFNQVNVILAILVENNPRIIPMKFQCNRTTGFRWVGFYRFLYNLTWWPSFQLGQCHFSNFGRELPKDYSYEISMESDNRLKITNGGDIPKGNNKLCFVYIQHLRHFVMLVYNTFAESYRRQTTCLLKVYVQSVSGLNQTYAYTNLIWKCREDQMNHNQDCIWCNFKQNWY